MVFERTPVNWWRSIWLYRSVGRQVAGLPETTLTRAQFVGTSSLAWWCMRTREPCLSVCMCDQWKCLHNVVCDPVHLRLVCIGCHFLRMLLTPILAILLPLSCVFEKEEGDGALSTGFAYFAWEGRRNHECDPRVEYHAFCLAHNQRDCNRRPLQFPKIAPWILFYICFA